MAVNDKPELEKTIRCLGTTRRHSAAESCLADKPEVTYFSWGSCLLCLLMAHTLTGTTFDKITPRVMALCPVAH